MKKVLLVFLSVTVLILIVLTSCTNISSGSSSNSSAARQNAITIKEESVTVNAGTGYPLGGTLTIPDGAKTPYPCVVLVAGSGPSDRDETANSDKPFKDIADYLASKGIAVLRFDKRTYTYPTQMEAVGADATVEQEYIQDSVAASNLLKADSRMDSNHVFILGHSEGGMLAPRIDAEGGKFAGIIIMAGSPRSLLEITYDQNMSYINATMTGDKLTSALSQMELYKQFISGLSTMTDNSAKATPLPGGISAYYYKEMDEHPVSKYLADIKTPFLIMRGLSDIQVFPADFQGYKDLLGNRDNVTFKEYNGLTHLFMLATENDVIKNKGNSGKLYSTTEHVDPQVLKDISDWIISNSK